MPARLLTVASDAHDPARVARFWAVLLDRQQDGGLLPGTPTQVGLRFVRSEARKTGMNRMHFHLTSVDDADQQRLVATALDLGAGHLDVGQRPEEGHIVLADPEGNEFCVIEPGNTFLAGCGRLGEIACEGTRDAGLFWSRALDWPLVWDQDEETAVQSPYGGTKVAWGGPPVAPRPARDRQRFELTAAGGDQRAEVERLIALGATLQAAGDGGSAELSDPDGNEFRVTGPPSPRRPG